MFQQTIPATYMRGGTSKGVFFRRDDLPADPAVRDRVLLRVIGSPDPYGKHTDGMGGATSSTSKVVLLRPSSRPDCDVDYLYGAVAIEDAVIDWSGNCGNLSAAVGPFAIHQGWVKAGQAGTTPVRIWQENLGERIVAHVPVHGGRVIEDGDFELDGVTFPAAEIRLDFLNPGAGDGTRPGGLFPTGHLIDTLNVPGMGPVRATLIDAGNATVFVDAATLGCTGAELQAEFNGNADLLARCEAIRAAGSVRMGLAATTDIATAQRPHTPKLAFVGQSLSYIASSGRPIDRNNIDVNIRILSMGKLHHAMTGTGAVAIAVAGAIPGKLVSEYLHDATAVVRFGHPSGQLTVGAQATRVDGQWTVEVVSMSRSARRLMQGEIFVPAGCLA